MKLIRSSALASLVLTGMTLWLTPVSCSRAADADRIRVLLVTGGHDYETNQFLKIFRDNPDLTVLTAAHPKAHDWFKTEAASQYDVIVLYDMWQDVTEEARANFLARLEQGKGLVALHHSLGSYQRWPEYTQIIGGKYHLEKRIENGVEKPASTYKHDVDFKVRVADPTHPVTKGLKDFDVHDETYGQFEVRPGVHALLTTDEPTSTRTIAWAKTYAGARVVYLQLGHDHLAYENPNYKRLVAQAIRWVAKKD
jgi:hypothetical protein